jgi:hypothetical protein
MVRPIIPTIKNTKSKINLQFSKLNQEVIRPIQLTTKNIKSKINLQFSKLNNETVKPVLSTKKIETIQRRYFDIYKAYNEIVKPKPSKKL